MIALERGALALPDALSGQGFALRNWRDEHDFEAMARVLCASRTADGLEESRTPQVLGAFYRTMKNIDFTREIFFIERDQELAAYCTCRWWEETNNTFIYAYWLFVVPEWRGKGIELVLQQLAQARLREIAGQHPQNAAKYFEINAMNMQHWIIDLARAEGLAPIRSFYSMVCSDLDHVPHAQLPDGLQVRPARSEHYRAVWQANVEAFADHWGDAVSDESDFERFLKRPDIQPEFWQVAWDGDQVAGMVLNFVDPNENEQFHRKRGHTEEICVRRPWRGRGVAKALLTQSMHMFREMGFDSTALNVDSENPTGALRLYESVGYKTIHTMTVYRKAM